MHRNAPVAPHVAQVLAEENEKNESVRPKERRPPWDNAFYNDVVKKAKKETADHCAGITLTKRVSAEYLRTGCQKFADGFSAG